MTTPSSSRSQRIVFCSLIVRMTPVGRGWGDLEALDDGGDAHAPADTQRGEAVATVAALELIDERAEDHAPGGTEWMPHGDGAPVDVDLLQIEIEVLDKAQHDGGERLVDLDQVEVLDGQAGLPERLAAGRGRTGEHDR